MVRLGMAIILSGVLLGCTDSVDPVIDSGHAYTLYGFLDAHADTQAVRVFAIEGTLDLIRPAPLGAEAISTELESGTQHQWQETIVEFTNGRFGHVYWAAFRSAYGKTYRLEMTRSDDVQSSVEVTVPPVVDPILLDPTLGIGYAIIPVLWQHAPRVHDIRVSYETNMGTYDFEYPLDQEMRSDGVVVLIRFSRDAREIFRDLHRARRPVADLRLHEVRLTVLISSSAWVPPNGIYDPDLLIEPGVFSNVVNGFGFVGAGYDTLMAFDPADSVKIAAGIPVGDN